MYCKNCGKEVNEKAIACTNCGLPPLSEKNFCQECGVETNEKQIMCIKCGVSLEIRGKSVARGGMNPESEYKGFYRSSDDKKIFGFCGGLAHKFGMQPSLVRVLTVVSAFFVVGWLYFVGPFLPSHPTKDL